MIEKIQLHNFQSHKNTELDFSAGVNVIIGSSDSGKSSVIRALRWVAYNKPRGNAFRSWWGGDTAVTLTIDSKELVRIRTNSKNGYELDNIEYMAIDTNIPEEVQSFLNITDMNLQQQLDSPFLLTKSPGDVAAHFNRIANLEKIDESLKSIQSEIRATEQNIKSSKISLSAKIEQIKSYNFLTEVDASVTSLEIAEKTIQINLAHREILESYIDKINKVNTEMKPLLSITVAEDDLLSILNKKKQVKKASALKDKLESLILEFIKIEERIKIGERYIAGEKALMQIIKLGELLSSKKDILNKLENVIAKITDVDTSLSQLTSKQIESEVLWKSSMGSVCPLCDQKIKQ